MSSRYGCRVATVVESIRLSSRYGCRVDPEGEAASIAADVEYALQTMGLEYLDIAVFCRVPQDVSIEAAMRGMAALVAAGKVCVFASFFSSISQLQSVLINQTV